MKNVATNVPNTIPLPEFDQTPERLIERARNLGPRVQADAALAEKRGRYSEELHEEFQNAGFIEFCSPDASEDMNSMSPPFSES